MTLSGGLVSLFIAVLLIEIGLSLLVWRLKRDFQWLISAKDTCPEIDPELIEAHIARGFDAELGWVRKPNTEGSDILVSSYVTFNIDSTGARLNPGFEEQSSTVAAFGDSFTFCRLVGNTETWPHFLSKELPKLDSKIIIMGIVPETLARIQSYWKHFFEYGNILAFKPMFTLENDGLKLNQPAVQDRSQYETVYNKIDKIKKLDRFFEEKFKFDFLNFPFSFRLILTWHRNAPILWHLAIGFFTGNLATKKRHAFNLIIKETR
jgi:hypothetical protein